MCLEHVSNEITAPNKGIGYKVYEKYGNKYKMFQGDCVPLNEQLHSSEVIINEGHIDQYPSGFHIFINKSDAERYACLCGGMIFILEVEYENVVAQGTDTGFNVIIARDMKLIKEL